MGHDDYCSDIFVTTTTHRQRKKREICRSFTCISPWFLFSRWFKGGGSRGSRNGFMERKWNKEKIGGDFDITRNSGRLKCSINHEAPSSSRVDVSECDKDGSCNLGVGLGLISLVTASRNELNKMVELHNRIELLLQNVQTETQNHDNMYTEEHDPNQYLSSHNVENPEIIRFSSGRYRREKSLRMDQLEAELEDEFDRLHLQMDDEICVKYSKQQFSEINVEDSAPEESHSEEVANELHECSYNEFYGVSPRELERKLHELLESRQQERITELESALEYAMEQLEERENELSWWKDTARLVSQHLSDIPSLLVNAKRPPLYSEEIEFGPRGDGKSLIRNVVGNNRAKLKVEGSEM